MIIEFFVPSNFYYCYWMSTYSKTKIYYEAREPHSMIRPVSLPASIIIFSFLLQFFSFLSLFRHHDFQSFLFFLFFLLLLLFCLLSFNYVYMYLEYKFSIRVYFSFVCAHSFARRPQYVQPV